MLIASTTLHMLGSCHRLSFWKQMLRCSLMHSVYYRFLRQEDEVSASGRERNKTMWTLILTHQSLFLQAAHVGLMSLPFLSPLPGSRCRLPLFCSILLQAFSSWGRPGNAGSRDWLRALTGHHVPPQEKSLSKYLYMLRITWKRLQVSYKCMVLHQD